MRTFASLFTGGGGADVGAIQAGLLSSWGVEYIPEIARVAEANLGHPIVIADILSLDPANFERVDVLHASPPCPNFSTAKTGARETELDIALGMKTADFVRVLRPRIFTLENVYGYRRAQAFRHIVQVLVQEGYQYRWWHLNAADYGVPQSRKRLVLVARLDGVPQRPMATHAPANKLAPLFDWRRPYLGWLEAIADLLPTLPTAYLKKGVPCPHDPDGRECRESAHCRGHFAPWQEARLPAHFSTMLLSQGISRNHHGVDYGRTTRRDPDEPAFVVTANANMDSIRAFILSNAKTEWGDGQVPDDEPMLSVTAQQGGRLRAFVVASNSNANSRGDNWRDASQPGFTVTSRDGGRTRALLPGRIVRITPRALARWQSFPDTYRLPKDRKTATTIIGNAVPPLLYQRVLEAQLKKERL